MRASSFDGPISPPGATYGAPDWRNQPAESLMRNRASDPRDDYGFNSGSFTGAGVGDGGARNEAFMPDREDTQSFFSGGKSLVDSADQALLSTGMQGVSSTQRYAQAKAAAQAQAKMAKVQYPKRDFFDVAGSVLGVGQSVGQVGNAAGWWG